MKRRVVRRSLLEPPRFFGVPVQIAFFEAVAVAASFGAFRLTRQFLVMVGAVILIHQILKWALRDDAQALHVFCDAVLNYRRVYPAHGLLLGPSRRKPRSCLPRI